MDMDYMFTFLRTLETHKTPFSLPKKGKNMFLSALRNKFRHSARRFSATAESTVAAYPGTVQAMHWISGGAMVTHQNFVVSLSSTLAVFIDCYNPLTL